MSTTNNELKTTPLDSLHRELNAKMVPFAGYAMPVQYPTGIIAEHKHTRAQAGLFDVSHMGQVRLFGVNAAAALESLAPVDVVGLEPGQQRYALFTNAEGGVSDDLMITHLGDSLLLIVNAACKEQDFAHLSTHLAGRCDVQWWPDRALLALQGPQAAQVLSRLNPQVNDLVFMTGAMMQLAGAECFVTRSGYTGEDGFEISAPAAQADELARRLLAQDEVKPIGLGARDSLRLEAGLCLYGHDIDTTTTPVEAALTWAISKARRTGGEREGGFPGAEIILPQIPKNVTRRRVGLQPEGRAPIREGVELMDNNGGIIGHVTSGGFGASVGGPVAMGYVATEFSEIGTEFHASVRGKTVPVKVAKLPFVKPGYYRG